MDIVDHHIDVPIVVEVAKSAATTGFRSGRRRAQKVGDVFKFSVLKITINHLSLFVGGFSLELIHLGIDVTISQKEIQPTIVIQVDEATTPAEPAGVKPDSSESHVLKNPAPVLE